MHILSLALHMSLPEPFVQEIPGSLVKFTMRPVPGGEIQIDGKTHKVGDLWVAETETTWDAYDIFAFRLDLTQEQQAAGVDAKTRPSKPYGAVDRGYGHKGYPAMSMTHHAAKLYCEWLTKKTGKPYRLPSEAEWRIAAGHLPDATLDHFAWFWDNADDKTHPVGKLAPNAFGLHDMLGNVSEWCEGVDGQPVAMGGSWAEKAEHVTESARAKQTPAWNMRDPQNPKSLWWLSDAPFVGFRVVLDR
ncbi:MAG: SUMF1/EgtB/PvdO family nonheme iron enzyme [Fimbriimonadaceae bacterium]|nr:SUMF1/EgtB/PvdO family nonheme iron enzyme [Fimbriimonadaceae bacterium]QYK56266.1 MAG: SUMF1/EgtB/PvdO family nonheme iron enzyme [Fimbriimonadaceae bacterium]